MSKPLRVYVAGAWVEKEKRAKPWIRRLREADVEITHDWTVDEIPSTAATDAQLPAGERARAAASDLNGVLLADVLWLLAPDERGASGAWTEFGYALGLRAAREHTKNRPFIIVSGVQHARTIFTSQADVSIVSDELAFAVICDMPSAGG